jgi:predicted nucleotidyltransferase
MDKQQIIQKLKTAKPLLQHEFGVTKLALFGSYSRDEQTDKSDIDIMVEYDKKLGMKFLDLIYQLDTLFDKEVQVVSRNAIKPKYFAAIQQDLIYV